MIVEKLKLQYFGGFGQQGLGPRVSDPETHMEKKMEPVAAKTVHAVPGWQMHRFTQRLHMFQVGEK